MLYGATPASAPAVPTPAFENATASQLTSLDAHVVPPATDGVNDKLPATTEICSCLVADARVMLVTVTAAAALVIAAVFVTLNVTLAGTVILACSLTFAVSVVDCELSGKLTVACAEASPAVTMLSAMTMDERTKAFLICSPWVPENPVVVTWDLTEQVGSHRGRTSPRRYRAAGSRASRETFANLVAVRESLRGPSSRVCRVARVSACRRWHVRRVASGTHRDRANDSSSSLLLFDRPAGRDLDAPAIDTS